MSTLEVIRITTTKIHVCKWAFFNKNIFSLGKNLESRLFALDTKTHLILYMRRIARRYKMECLKSIVGRE